VEFLSIKKNKKNNLIVIDESKKGFIFAAVSGISTDDRVGVNRSEEHKFIENLKRQRVSKDTANKQAKPF